MLLPADLVLFATVALAFVVALGLVTLALRLAGFDPFRVLTRREWLVTAKLVGCVALAFVLYQAVIAFDFPSEGFIYGRF